MVVVIADGKQTRPAYVDITLAVMRSFGVEVINDDYRRFTVPVDRGYTGTRYLIEPDYSAAGYFLAWLACSAIWKTVWRSWTAIFKMTSTWLRRRSPFCRNGRAWSG